MRHFPRRPARLGPYLSSWKHPRAYSTNDILDCFSAYTSQSRKPWISLSPEFGKQKQKRKRKVNKLPVWRVIHCPLTTVNPACREKDAKATSEARDADGWLVSISWLWVIIIGSICNCTHATCTPGREGKEQVRTSNTSSGYPSGIDQTMRVRQQRLAGMWAGDTW